MSLSETIRSLGLTDTEAMNLLQDAGVISDNCVTVADVANWQEAADWLRKWKEQNE